ncbi:hypothetical protein V5O48_006356 [Marasmius crinis-equi]|uniref:Uncharacterized protein n=1 Tax=Marasmius crinis-equi TaxID=585013 RepID=A0ABR3FKD8_9AGAR
MSSQGTDNGRGGFVLYYYTPNIAAAGIFAGVFLLSTILHIWQLVRTRTWYFLPMVIGALMEGTGYIGRILSHSDPNKLGPYIMQSVLLLVAPALFAASIYMILGRLISRVEGEEYSIIKVTRLTKVFVWCDVLSFLVQSSGAGLMVRAGSTSLGEKIILAGLIIQIVAFGIFIVVSLIFHLRMNKAPTAASRTHEQRAAVPWNRMLWVLYTASAFIMIRSVFRFVEYVQGFSGYLLRNEVWLYIFDALLMGITVWLFNWFHPSRAVVHVEGYEETRGSKERIQMMSA